MELTSGILEEAGYSKRQDKVAFPVYLSSCPP